MRDFIHDIKFRHRKSAAVGLGNLWASIADESNFCSADYIVPVPLHPDKKRERGFNQAQIMACPLSERFNIFLADDLLIRLRNTPPQSGLNLHSRAENVAGAFDFNPKFDVKHKKIILVDDIYTTGASLNECAKILKQHGAEEVKCMTLTVTLKKNKKKDDK